MGLNQEVNKHWTQPAVPECWLPERCACRAAGVWQGLNWQWVPFVAREAYPCRARPEPRTYQVKPLLVPGWFRYVSMHKVHYKAFTV